MASEQVHLSVVAPFFNEEETLGEFLLRTLSVLDSQPYSSELVVVDDGSKDSSARIVHRFQTDPGRVGAATSIRIVQLTRNFGHQAAISAGICHARGHLVAVLDSDLQDPPELVPEMVALLFDQDADVVRAVRRSRAGESWVKKKSASMFYRILRSTSESPILLNAGDFYVLGPEVVTFIKNLSESPKFIRGLVSWFGGKQLELPYDRQERLSGVTKYSPKKMANLAVTALTSFSVKPLNISIQIAVVSGAIFSILAAWACFSWLSGSTAPGWASIALIVSSFSTLQFFYLAVLGTYLGKIHHLSLARPQYLVRSERPAELTRGDQK